ncbi:hypothetical protein DL770_006686 [Monosporascus sp. CRB-9-2]|nr:hypothetical protein DL770_006686 [Monosporascus sp. CRB-9-2]
MRIPLSRRTAKRSYLKNPASWLFLLASFSPFSHAINIEPIPNPGLDVSDLGRIGIAGDFVGISYYQYEGQSERPFSMNGSESLLTRLPNGMFLSLQDADASIRAMCVFQDRFIILAGNFTSLNGVQSPTIVSYDTTDLTSTPLDGGVQGEVNALLCDNEEGVVYVGGNFRTNDSTNAITWVDGGNWSSLPFAGFNGPVTSIAKAGNGHIIFGGRFTGLGNVSAPSDPDAHVINLSTANIQAEQTTSMEGFSDPRNIVCNTDSVDGPGNTWLLRDEVPGAWRASFGFGFQPTKLRLRNTHQDGRGTRTWRFTALPLNGIMNFTYIDPASGQNRSCTSECPLSDDPDVEFQDFQFVNEVGMNEFRLDISAWYGSGGGLNGIELFQEKIFTYAINDFNEPACANISTPARASSTGPWTVTPSGGSNSRYLSAEIPSPVEADAATVTFYPDIREPGEYTINLYTPGCLQDGTCLRRGQFTVTGTLTSDGENQDLIPNGQSLYQSNNYEKYDQLIQATVDASSDSFRPSVTLAPLAGQSVPEGTMVMVAQRIEFVLMQNSTRGLNGLFEYDPSRPTVNATDFKNSAFNRLGSSFSDYSAVTSLVTSADVAYIGGNFTSDSVRNIVAISGNDTAPVPLDGGLNGEVTSMLPLENQLYVGGRFNNSLDGSAEGLNNVAAYDTAGNVWSPLGAGVDGAVNKIVSMTLNLTSDAAEDVITLTGTFKQLLAFGDNEAVEVDGFAVWVPSQNNWLQNLDAPIPFLGGFLSASVSLSNGSSFYAGSLSAQALRANGVVALGDELGTFPINIRSPTASNASTSNVSKRESLANRTDSYYGVTCGLFREEDGRNITVLGGHFTADATDGSTINNLAFIDHGDSDRVAGIGDALSEDTVFLALALEGDNLFAGGRVGGTVSGAPVNGLISYSLGSMSYNTQPPALAGGNVTVSSIEIRPDTADVYVGGSFDSAGSLPCPGVCVFNTGTNQWNRPGNELNGDVNCMMWISDSILLAGGDFTINDTNTYLMSYDASSSTWTGFTDASTLPGPIEAMTQAADDGSQVWAAGTDSDGEVYLRKFDGSSWVSPEITFEPDTIISSLRMFTLTESHEATDLVDESQILMITGSIALTDFGTASSVIFDGATLRPYALTSGANNTAGSISGIFTQRQYVFPSADEGGMPLGFIVLIALAISLGLMLLIVVAGLALDRYRKMREGYLPAPTSMFDRGSGLSRIPPNELLGSLNKGKSGAPHV